MTAVTENGTAQLTLKIDTPRKDYPIAGGIKIAGAMTVHKDLTKDTKVSVAIIDENGVVMAEAEAEVSGISFKTKHPETGSYVERMHTITL